MDAAAKSTEEYKLLRPKYARLSEKFAALMKELIAAQEIKAEFEYRAKTVESFAEKIVRPGKNYTNPLLEVSDLAGLRVILHSLTDANKVADLINAEFEVDEDRSVNKIDQLDPDRFGYLSQHYIVKLDEARSKLSEWNGLAGLYIEIQVRTTMQNAWAVIQHALEYKASVDVPKKLRRRLYRVSALLELADEELDNFAKEIRTTIEEYKDQIESGDISAGLDVESLRVYIETSDEAAYWNNVLRTRGGHRVETWGDLSRDVKIAEFVGITTLNQLDVLLKRAHGWGEKFFEAYYRRYFKEHNVNPSQVTTVVNGAITQLLIAANYPSLSEEILGKDFGYYTFFILEEAEKAHKDVTR